MGVGNSVQLIHNGVPYSASGGGGGTLGQQTMAASAPVVIASNQSNVPVNNVQIGGVAVATGNGVAGTGVQRVAIASDQTAFTVNATFTPPGASGTSITPFNSAAVIALAVVKASAGRMLRYRIYNPNASVAYLQAFNAATTGAVTLGTTVPIEIFPVPAGAVLEGDQDFSFAYPAGIVIAATTTPTGNTAVTTGLVATIGYV